MNTLTNLYYSKDHNWVDIRDNIVLLGITNHAQSTLGEIVFLDLPEEGSVLTTDNSFGSIESIKTTSELIAPFSGKVLKVNTELEDNPEYVNESLYDKAWILEVEAKNLDSIHNLMSSEEYEDYVQEG
jgi:glycine cleavage system H protein